MNQIEKCSWHGSDKVPEANERIKVVKSCSMRTEKELKGSISHT